MVGTVIISVTSAEAELGNNYAIFRLQSLREAQKIISDNLLLHIGILPPTMTFHQSAYTMNIQEIQTFCKIPDFVVPYKVYKTQSYFVKYLTKLYSSLFYVQNRMTFIGLSSHVIQNHARIGCGQCGILLLYIRK